MPFRPIRPPRPGSIDLAAQRIYEILERDEREKARRNSRLQLAQAPSPGGSGPVESPTAESYPQSQTHPYPPPSLQYRQTPEARDRLINWIIDRFENRYSNDPDDPGGETMWGITQKAIDDYRQSFDKNFNLTPRQISRDQAVQIYDSLIRKYRLDEIADPDLRAHVIDTMVNPGIGHAGEFLLNVLEQRGHNVRISPDDKVIGSRALGAIRGLVNRREENELARMNNALARERRRHYLNEIAKYPYKEKWRDGWIERAAAFRILPTGRVR